MKAIIALFAILVVGTIALFVTSGHTTMSLTPPVKTIGVSTPVTVKAFNSHGERRLTAYIEQNGARSQLFSQASPATRFFWQRSAPPRLYMFDAGKTKAPNLKEGKARLVVEAISNDMRASADTAAFDVDVVLAAPRVIPDAAEHDINQGGMELVTFTPSGSWSEAGVKVGDYSFRSFPLPGHPDERFSMFAYPWDLPSDVGPLVYARNLAGTEATAHFFFKLFPKKFRARDFPVDDALMEKLVNSVDPTGQLAPGPDLLSRFLKINGEMRRQNNQQLADLRFKTEEKILWHGPFIHWGKEEANFADVRNYMYHGKKVDQQVHLGFDLSDNANTPVRAANDGRVVWAANLGIYGNCIVLDHGYALQSIYGHLRQIDVKVGDVVQRGQTMGFEGQTGLAGGIHLHFSMQIDGVQTNPREWWDEHWIKDRILSKLDPSRIETAATTVHQVAHKTQKRKH
ncbi:MAG: M23 family metallopeptidase [Bryobacteraceae bacterium]|jgi:murein DD-endopeptidase MepM/ murein hydrolase activator NlpD